MFARRRVIAKEKSSPTRAPVAAAARTAISQDPVTDDTITETNAPASIFASSAMLTMPACLLISPPIAASRIGVVRTIEAANT